MIKWWRILFWECPRRRCEGGGLRKAWQDDDDENLKTWGVSGLSSMWLNNPYNLSYLCSDIYKVLLLFFWNTTNILVEYWKQFCLSKTCLSIALSCMFKLCMYVCIVTNLKVILIFGQLFHQEKAGSSWS